MSYHIELTTEAEMRRATGLLMARRDDAEDVAGVVAVPADTNPVEVLDPPYDVVIADEPLMTLEHSDSHWVDVYQWMSYRVWMEITGQVN